MKSLSILKSLFIATWLILNITACQEKQEEVDARQTHLINGLVYKIHAQEPFTGKILNATDFTGYLNTHIYLSRGVLKAGESIVILKDHYCNMEVKHGLLDGTLTCYSHENQKFFEAQYANGLKQGNSTFKDPQTGILLIEAQWTNDQKNGLETIYMNDGVQINAKTHWLAGKKSGVEQIYNPTTKQLVSEITWNNGHEEQVKRWDISGQHLLHHYTVSQGQKTGFTIHEEGGRRLERTYQDGKLHGIQNDYEMNADKAYQLVRTQPYDMGLKHGTHSTFDRQGHLLEEVEYKNGVAISVLKQKWQDGILREKSHYINTKIEDSYRTSDFNDVRKDNLTKHGQELKFDDNSKVVLNLLWDNGRKVSGTAQSWYGNTDQLDHYCERRQEGEYVSGINAQKWAANGQLIAQTQWIEVPKSPDKPFLNHVDIIVLSDQGWSHGGQLLYEIHAEKNGMPLSYKKWTEEGVLILDQAWQNGNRVHHRVWNTKGEPLSEKIWQNGKLSSFKSWDTLNRPDKPPVFNKEFTYDANGNIVKAWILDFYYEEHIENEARDIYEVDARSQEDRKKIYSASSYDICGELFTDITDANFH